MLTKFNQHDNEHFYICFPILSGWAPASATSKTHAILHTFSYSSRPTFCNARAVVFEILLLSVESERVIFYRLSPQSPLKRDEDITIPRTEIFRDHDFHIKCVALPKFEGVWEIQNSFPWQRFSIFPAKLVGSEVRVLDPFYSWQHLDRDKHVNSP